jgi:hypothetical protein
MSQDDFPPTQQAPPPPPEPPPVPPGRDSRAITHTASVYEGVEHLLPARTWKESPLVWIALVVAMFMAVPLLASMATRDTVAKPPKPRAEAPARLPANPPADAEPAPATAVPVVAPAPARAIVTPTPGNVSDLPPNLRPQTDASRQMITKCYENGRVVYTQTGKCTGSMSAVPIDTGKNVVGPGNAPAAPGGTTR